MPQFVSPPPLFDAFPASGSATAALPYCCTTTAVLLNRCRNCRTVNNHCKRHHHRCYCWACDGYEFDYMSCADLTTSGLPSNYFIQFVNEHDRNRNQPSSQELGAGKNLISGEYELPSGGQLPFAAMIARLKRLRVLDDVMRVRPSLNCRVCCT